MKIHPRCVRPAGRRPISFLGAALALAFGTTGASAMTLTADYHVPLTPENAIIGCFSATKKPVLTVAPGAIVQIDGGGGIRYQRPATAGAPAAIGVPSLTAEAVDAWLKDNAIATTVETNPALQETLKVLQETPRAPGIPSGHLIVGPIYVEGAEPGDTLEVRILDVSPRIPYGSTGSSPGGGGLPDVTPRPFTKVIHLDLKRNAGVFDHDVEVPLAPFMGVMATCPADAEGPYRRSGPPGAFGGNLDCKWLSAGATLYLPVFQKGALFYTGDSHAGQGDGEVTGGAIETADTCTLQFFLRKGEHLKMPRAETATYYLTFGLDPDLNKAMHQAILETIDFLKEKQHYDFFDAYALTSIGVDFHVTQVVDKTNGIHGMIPKYLFPHDPNPYWYRPL
jgi:acetamidase/formamidase